MRYLLIFLLLIEAFNINAQYDTIAVDNFAVFKKSFFSNLDPQKYQGKLIDRSAIDGITELQCNGIDEPPHNWADWFTLYHDLYNANYDTTALVHIDEIYDLLIEKKSETILDIEENTEGDFLIAGEIDYKPFGLILYDTYKLKDSSFLHGKFDVVNQKFVPLVNEEMLYDSMVFKSAAVLDVYNSLGYDKAKLVYSDEFIQTSESIQLNALEIDIGTGYQPFNSNDNEIIFNVRQDTTLAYAKVIYEYNNNTITDTISFVLSVKGSSTNQSRSLNIFDQILTYKQDFTSLYFTIGLISGCGNSRSFIDYPPNYERPTFASISQLENYINYIRRPIILFPPYRPKPQNVSLEFYYDKYNISGFIDEMVAKGYDILIIREEPGNPRISVAGKLIADFLNDINIIKKHNYPSEYWENIIFGFSAGGQHARYGLNEAEMRHMIWGDPHHHTRLYIPFDSPHNGANVSVSFQTAYWEYKRTGSILADQVYKSLVDDGSKDMLVHNIVTNNIPIFGHGTFNVPLSASNERLQLINELENNFNHIYKPQDDLRKTYPAFTRNIAVSMGRYDQNYEDEYGLENSKLLFSQTTPKVVTKLYSAPLVSGTILNRYQLKTFPIPLLINRNFNAINSSAYDKAKGGHKNVFYDGEDQGLGQIIGAVQVMRFSSLGFGTKHYDNNVCFMPLTSALCIANGNNAFNLHNFNPQDEGLMFQKFGFDPVDDKSDHFGYPHLGRPNDHFDITPFEAIYADRQTYEHIDVINTVDAQNIAFLDSLKNFMRDEIEGERVYLQNKVIGKNHINWDPNYEYEAWYKAEKEIHIGNKVTPKTNPGDYVIEPTGNITTYAGERVVLKPGFHAQDGSHFHAYIDDALCVQNRSLVSVEEEDDGGSGGNTLMPKKIPEEDSLSDTPLVTIYPNPNNGSFVLQVSEHYLGGQLTVFDTFGKKVYLITINKREQDINFEGNPGLYYGLIVKNGYQHIEKIMVQ